MRSKPYVLGVLIHLWAILPGWGRQEEDPERKKILEKLNSQIVSVNFNAISLEDAVGFLREISGLNIIMSAEVHKLAPEQLTVTLKLEGLRLKSVLKLLLHDRGLTATIRNGVLVVLPKAELDQKVTTRIHDVRDLLFKIQDFPGPTVELESSQHVVKPVFIIPDEPRSSISEDFVQEIIRTHTAGGKWADNPNAGLSLANGMLIVTQTASVHREVEHVLNLLRQYK